MRDYGRVSTAFWTDDKMPEVSERARMLALYCLTSPHTNAIGCFRLPSGYIADDLQWDRETVTQTLSELLGIGFLDRCERTGWTLIRKYLEYNPIENPNVGKACIKQVESVPRSVPFFSNLINALEPYAERFPDGWLKGLAKGSPNPMANIKPKPEPEPEPEPKREAVMTAAPSPDEDWAVREWNLMAADLGIPEVRSLANGRRAKLKKCLSANEWLPALAKIRASPFCQGRNDRGWKVDIDFVLTETKRTRLLEGKYDESPTHRESATMKSARVLHEL